MASLLSRSFRFIYSRSWNLNAGWRKLLVPEAEDEGRVDRCNDSYLSSFLHSSMAMVSCRPRYFVQWADFPKKFRPMYNQALRTPNGQIIEIFTCTIALRGMQICEHWVPSVLFWAISFQRSNRSNILWASSFCPAILETIPYDMKTIAMTNHIRDEIASHFPESCFNSPSHDQLTNAKAVTLYLHSNVHLHLEVIEAIVAAEMYCTVGTYKEVLLLFWICNWDPCQIIIKWSQNWAKDHTNTVIVQNTTIRQIRPPDCWDSWDARIIRNPAWVWVRTLLKDGMNLKQHRTAHLRLMRRYCVDEWHTSIVYY